MDRIAGTDQGWCGDCGRRVTVDDRPRERPPPAPWVAGVEEPDEPDEPDEGEPTAPPRVPDGITVEVVLPVPAPAEPPVVGDGPFRSAPYVEHLLAPSPPGELHVVLPWVSLRGQRLIWAALVAPFVFAMISALLSWNLYRVLTAFITVGLITEALHKGKTRLVIGRDRIHASPEPGVRLTGRDGVALADVASVGTRRRLTGGHSIVLELADGRRVVLAATSSANDAMAVARLVREHVAALRGVSVRSLEPGRTRPALPPGRGSS